MSGAVSFAAAAEKLVGNGYRPFPTFAASKRPALIGWNSLCVEQWEQDELAGMISLMADTSDMYSISIAFPSDLVGIDIDVIDPELSGRVVRAAEHHLGGTIVRVGQAPKQLRLYKTDDPAVRSKKLHPVELFCGSGQCVIFGEHPKALNGYYEWLHGSPLDVKAADLPAIDAYQVNAFLNVAAEILPAHKQPMKLGLNRIRTGTIEDRLRFLKIGKGPKIAIATVLSEAIAGNRNETGYLCVSFGRGWGLEEAEIVDLFERHFDGWEGFTRDQLDSALARTEVRHG